MTEKQMRKVCEIAQRATEKECARKGIEVYHIEKNGDSRYTEDAQDIFNKHYDEKEVL
jgi:hypothetical protein|tara:strand:+ start:752 stop:925 length:174 start_codon:yes stop_codon:yes gene_type:complete